MQYDATPDACMLFGLCQCLQEIKILKKVQPILKNCKLTSCTSALNFIQTILCFVARMKLMTMHFPKGRHSEALWQDIHDLLCSKFSQLNYFPKEISNGLMDSKKNDLLLNISLILGKLCSKNRYIELKPKV